MGIKFEDFILKNSASGIKICPENGNTFDVQRNYKVATPSSEFAPAYVTYGNKSDFKGSCFMQCIGEINVNGLNEKLFEEDIIDFEIGGVRTAGVVIYDKEAFGWKLMTLDTKDIYEIRDVKAVKHLGSLYDHKTFAGCNIELIYKLLGEEMPKATKYASLDEPIPFKVSKKKEDKPAPKEDDVKVYVDVRKDESGKVNWGYRLEYKDLYKSDSQTFRKSVNRKEYYMVASTIIALSKLKKPAPITLYTSMQGFADVINNKQLKTWADMEWINKDSGKKEDSLALLKELKGHMDRLGGNVSAVVVKDVKIA